MHGGARGSGGPRGEGNYKLELCGGRNDETRGTGRSYPRGVDKILRSTP
jgi:hypothetical protein